MIRAAYMRRYREMRRLEGKCIACGLPSNRGLCERCEARHNAAQKNYRVRRA